MVHRIRNRTRTWTKDEEMSGKILLLGPARSGKDEAAKILKRNFGISCCGSSQFANREFIFPELSEKYGYKTEQECYEDRVNHRKEWYDLICEYNKKDPARLAKDILKDHDCYVGMRDITEFYACIDAGLFDHILWIHRDGCCEDWSSMNIPWSIYYRTILNNWSLEHLEIHISAWHDIYYAQKS